MRRRRLAGDGSRVARARVRRVARTLVAGLAGSAVLAACASTLQATHAPTASPAAATPATSATPAPATTAAPSAVATQLQGILDGVVGPDVPGVIARVDTPAWTWTGAAGKASVDPPMQADPAMHTRVASVSKMFTAVAVLRLAEEGKLALDNPLDRWLPAVYLDRMRAKGFDPSRITIRHLLTHRSGIHDYDEMGVVVPAQMAQPGTPLTTDFAIFDGIDRGPADYPPGGGFEYSNPGYALLTRVIDEASGSTYEDYLRRTILEPLGMTATSLPTDPPTPTVPEPALRALIQETPGTGPWLDFTDMYVDWDRGSGDVISTVADLATFHRALREGRIISPASFALMRDFLPAEEKFTYGMGYQRVPSSALGVAFEGHNGGYPGAVTDVFYVPERDAYITIARNGNLVSVPTMRGLASVLLQAP